MPGQALRGTDPVGRPYRRRAGFSFALLALVVLVLPACAPVPADPSSPSSETGAGSAAPPANEPTPSSEPARSARAGKVPDALAELAATAAERRLSAAFLIVDGVYNTELTAPYDVLEHSLYHAPDGLGIQPFTVAPSLEPVTTAEGLRLLADHDFASAPDFDILVVPSAQGSRDRDLESEELIAWVRNRGGSASLVMSLCWGAFVLAEADLLTGASCTTFPGDYDAFAKRYPELDLRINVSFVHDGKALTSQGGARSFDAAMYLVERLYGEAAATGVGRGLLIPWPPEAGDVPYLRASR